MSRNTSSRWPCWIRRPARSTIFPMPAPWRRDAKQTLYSGLAFSRDGSHIYASMGSITNPLGDGKDKTGSGVDRLQLRGGQNRARALHPAAAAAAGPGTKDEADRRGAKAIRECRFRQRSPLLARQARKSFWSPIISLTMFSCSIPPAAQSRGASISLKAMPCPAPIPSPSQSQKMASEPL